MQDFEGFTGRLNEDFHFHVYFATETRDSVLAIRDRLKHGADFDFDLPPVREQPIGPHRWPIWSIWVDRANFTAATLWMMQNHGSHSVLLHPETADSLADHSIHAMWLGRPQPLNLDVFGHQ